MPKRGNKTSGNDGNDDKMCAKRDARLTASSGSRVRKHHYVREGKYDKAIRALAKSKGLPPPKRDVLPMLNRVIEDFLAGAMKVTHDQMGSGLNLVTERMARNGIRGYLVARGVRSDVIKATLAECDGTMERLK